MKKEVLILLLILLSVAQAQETYIKDEITVTNSRPEITVVFDEQVTIVTAQIIGLEENIFYSVNYTTEDNILFLMNANNYLINGNYELQIYYQDYMGNPSQVIQPFIVDAPAMNIWIESPPLGASQIEVFDVTVKSEEDSQCRYSPIQNPPPNAFNYNFLFDLEESTSHFAYGINSEESLFYLNNPSPDENGFYADFYVKCNDENGITHLAELYLTYDPTPPSLGVSITPNPITDPNEPFTELTLTSTDRVVCTYTENGEQNEFDDYYPEEVLSYKKEHLLILDFTELGNRPIQELFDEELFEYDITCTNLAGLTATAGVSLTVAFEDEFSINMNSPGSYTNEESVDFEIETSIQTLGGCIYGVGTADNDFSEVIDNKVYKTNLGSLAEGEYSYVVNCVALSSKTKTLDFAVDRTEPVNLSIEMGENSCSLDTVNAIVSASDDNEIDRFNYSVVKVSDILVEGSTNSGEISQRVDMEENETYKLVVTAYDEANNFLQGEKSFVAKPSSAVECDYVSPNTFIEETPTSEGLVVDIGCSDIDSGCLSAFKYGLSSETETCNILEHTQNLNESIILLSDQIVCWIVYDLNNNNATGEEFVEFITPEEVFPPHCFNNETDAFETDVDCGGECVVCESGSACFDNSDCSSNSCNPLILECVEPNCENNYQDGDESDVDCGGSCNICSLGQSCSSDNDCETDVCSNSICSEDLTTDTDYDGMPDYWEEEYNFDINDPTDADEDTDNDGFTNLEEFKAGTDPLDENSKPFIAKEEESDFIAWILIIFGLVLIIAGVVFLFLEQKKKSFKPTLIDEKGLPEIKGEKKKLSEDESRVSEEETFEKQVINKKKRRDKLMSSFKKEESDDEVVVKKAKRTIEKEPKKLELEKTKKSGEKEKARTGDYIDVSELKKEEELKDEDIGKDVFQELEIITGETEETVGEKKESTEKKLEEKPLEEEKKTSDEIVDEKKEESKKELNQDEIFKQLAELVGKSHEEVRKTVGEKEELDSKEIMKVFANVTSKEQINANVFKALLSHLLKTGKVSKQTVAEILFEFLDKELLTKKEVSDLLKELHLTK